ncbi:unnamed protein product [Mytilus coruscus]|uniref:Uncharacterized protein n=1 Tax=Mytilus coruscus TaxID=42192 RepID=A0A6J8C4P4_MYTCO|nr:unnamed protein product [Mytilus coruscus]
MPVFKDKVRYEIKQFVAAAIVSDEEFEKEDTKIITEAKSKLEEAIKTKDFSDIYDNYSLSFNRLVVLVNTPRPKRHGKARLLDPFGDIRKGILKCPFDGSFINDNDINFLEKLKEMFSHDFGHNRYLIVIFSHIIPCTEPIHQCAQIVNKFAEQQNTTVIVSYEKVYELTDETEALEIMKTNEKIKFQRPTTLPHYSSSYLEPYDLEEEPGSSRMSRRDKKEKMRPGPYRPERKKRKSFSRQNSYEYRI